MWTRGDTDLSSVGGGEDPHGSPALLHVPKEPQGRHLVGFRGHVDVDKQLGKVASGSSIEKETSLSFSFINL